MPSLKPKPVRASLTQLSDLTYPPNANIHGSVFGGFILQMVDKAAAVCAMRHSGKACVTVAMERVEFLIPIRVGEYVIVEACLNSAGRTSMEVGVEVYSENLADGTRKHTNSCLVTMVAIGDDKKPTAIPPLLLETPEEKARSAAAEARKKARRAR
jgi:acyl-CoA hydrolase